jgi:hypothetical protein
VARTDILRSTAAARPTRRRAWALGAGLVLAGCGTGLGVGAAPDAPATPVTTPAAQVRDAARAGAQALADAVAAGAEPRGPMEPGSALDALVRVAGDRRAEVRWADRGDGSWATSGVATVAAPEGGPTTCVKVPLTVPGTALPVRDAARGDAAAVAGAGAVALFDAPDGSDCTALVEPPTTNLVPDPSAETGTSGWVPWQATLAWDDAGRARFGAHAVAVAVDADAGEGSVRAPVAPVEAAGTYVASVWVLGPGATVCVGVHHLDPAGGFLRAGACSGPVALGDGWQRLVLAPVAVPEGTGGLAPYVSVLGAGATVLVDAVQLEPGTAATGFAEGDLGPGYRWDGPHGRSPSVRAAGVGIA